MSLICSWTFDNNTSPKVTNVLFHFVITKYISLLFQKRFFIQKVSDKLCRSIEKKNFSSMYELLRVFEKYLKYTDKLFVVISGCSSKSSCLQIRNYRQIRYLIIKIPRFLTGHTEHIDKRIFEYIFSHSLEFKSYINNDNIYQTRDYSLMIVERVSRSFDIILISDKLSIDINAQYFVIIIAYNIRLFGSLLQYNNRPCGVKYLKRDYILPNGVSS